MSSRYGRPGLPQRHFRGSAPGSKSRPGILWMIASWALILAIVVFLVSSFSPGSLDRFAQRTPGGPGRIGSRAQKSPRTNAARTRVPQERDADDRVAI